MKYVSPEYRRFRSENAAAIAEARIEKARIAKKRKNAAMKIVQKRRSTIKKADIVELKTQDNHIKNI